MKLYNEMMKSLIELRTQYIDLQFEALKNNDSRMYNHYQLKLEKVTDLMEEVRKNMMKW